MQAFMPSPDLHGRLAVWIYDIFWAWRACRSAGAAGVAALAISLGAWSLLAHQPVLPGGPGHAASGSGRGVRRVDLPLRGTSVLFLVPALVFLIAAGVSSLLRSTATRPVELLWPP